MPNYAAKNYVKHPTTQIGEALCLATKYAHNALSTLLLGRVLNYELQQKVQKIINKRLLSPEYEAFRRLIELHYVQGMRMHDVHRILGISLSQAYAWRSEIELLVADELFLVPVLVVKNKKEIIEILKEGLVC